MTVKVELQDLIQNPTPRLPVILVLDTSTSMTGEPIDELNDGLELFVDSVRSDPTARYSAELCVMTYGGGPRVIQNFATVDRIGQFHLSADGHTPMGEAVERALEILENRKSLYKQTGVDYYQPWMVLMTDGLPTDDIEEASRKVQLQLAQKKLVVFPLAIGPYAEVSTLARFSSPNRPPLKLKGLNFKEFFQWLSKSVSAVSRSTPGASVRLPSDISGWAEL